MFNRIAATVQYFQEARAFLRHPLMIEEAQTMVQEQFRSRESSFLKLLAEAVYSNPGSPYSRLLQHAGIELGDVKRRVEESGLEAVLGELHDAGVYVTQDEFKGRIPIRRKGLEFSVKASDFANPLVRKSAMATRSSGSTGAATRVAFNFEDATYRMAEMLLAQHARSAGRPMGLWVEMLPRAILWDAKVGIAHAKAYTTTGFRWSADGFRSAGLLGTTLLATRFSGLRPPRPEVVSKDEALRIVRWLAERTADGRPAYFVCSASPSVRICLAAKENGLDISGTLFRTGGEPYTPAKAVVLASVGAKAMPTYSMNEAGFLGFGCETPAETDDLHLLIDKIAVVQRDHITPAGETVGALIFTSLLPTAPRLLLNTYTGDYGTVSRRDCGCLVARIGLTTHVSNLRSFEKLTCEGVTFVGSRIYSLVEEVLPTRFGGQLNDYQLLEDEAEHGLPRVSILVSPRVGAVEERAVIETVLKELTASHAGGGGDLMAAQWRQAKTLRVVRREPEETAGKVPPLRIRPKTRSMDPEPVVSR